MDPFVIIDKYYTNNPKLRHILVTHSTLVAENALRMAKSHPLLEIDTDFVWEAALLHDIGIFLTNAPSIYCTGTYPYIAHGYLGAELLRSEGLPAHALVCERHTGTGLALKEIILSNLPLPHRDMCPVTLEEQLICFSDKFFSKTHPEREKTLEQARASIAKYGEESLSRFDTWSALFI